MSRKRKVDISGLEGGSAPSANGGETNPWTGLPLSSRYYEILQKRKALPVYGFKEKFEDLIMKHQVLVVEGRDGQWQNNADSTILTAIVVQGQQYDGCLHTTSSSSDYECVKACK